MNLLTEMKMEQLMMRNLLMAPSMPTASVLRNMLQLLQPRWMPSMQPKFKHPANKPVAASTVAISLQKNVAAALHTAFAAAIAPATSAARNAIKNSAIPKDGKATPSKTLSLFANDGLQGLCLLVNFFGFIPVFPKAAVSDDPRAFYPICSVDDADQDEDSLKLFPNFNGSF
ncbi:hypothetical protein L7F22_047088 [Adiantum nelumboides]|nr:hypothetical protein [Adiantum nelumboides]